MRLLIIDPNMNLSSPSMKGVVRSLAAWRARGIETEVWCWTSDENLSAHIDNLPRIGDIPVLSGLFFSWLVWWRAWWRFKVRQHPRPDVIYTVAWYHMACDVAHVHFSPFDWESRQKLLGMHSIRDFIERVANAIYLHRARRFLHRTTAKQIVSVSSAVAHDIHSENAKLPIQVLPNSYDSERFHPEVRAQFRSAMRAKLNFKDDQKVFVFVSAGHYRRKGFFLAVEALKLLHELHPNVRFLVVGGRPKRLAALQAEIGQQYDWITFTGMVPDVEKYFAAADALLFPSYSEAFALVEVEAAACGLPLFLTPHHGSEMILEDGINGRHIDFDAKKISSVLGEFVTSQWQPQRISLKHAIDAPTYAQRLGDLLLAAA